MVPFRKWPLVTAQREPLTWPSIRWPPLQKAPWIWGFATSPLCSISICDWGGPEFWPQLAGMLWSQVTAPQAISSVKHFLSHPAWDRTSGTKCEAEAAQEDILLSSSPFYQPFPGLSLLQLHFLSFSPLLIIFSFWQSEPLPLFIGSGPITSHQAQEYIPDTQTDFHTQRYSLPRCYNRERREQPTCQEKWGHWLHVLSTNAIQYFSRDLTLTSLLGPYLDLDLNNI